MTKPKIKQKKTDRSRESPASGTAAEAKSSHTPPAASPDAGYLLTPGGGSSAKATSQRVSFAAEIQSMMYALGDCRRPLLESAEAIEDILHKQMTSLLQRAADVCTIRNARFIGIEDFIFLLRNDRDKLKRLLQFLLHKDQRQKLAKVMGATGEDEDQSELDQKVFCRRQKISYDFLSTIDQSGDLLSLLDGDESDPIKTERMERAEMKTRYMDSNTYKEYTEARQANFAKKGSKFKEWLDCSSLEPKPNPFAMEIMQYLAYETVAQLVELSFLVSRDMQAVPWDPLTKTASQLCSNNLPSPGPFLAKPSPASTPLQSPTSSPTSPNGKMVSPFLSSTGAGAAALNASHNSNSSDGSFHNQGDSKTSLHSSTSSKSKSKRKKKPSGSSLQALIQYRAIKPVHIREAYRRLQESSTPMAPFCKYTSHPEKRKFLAC